MSLQPLREEIREQFERRNFLSRTHASICAIRAEKGQSISALAIGTLSASSVVGGALCWLTLEGAVRSIIDVIEDDRFIVRLRGLGDAGGWTSLSLFTVLAVKGVYEVVIHEGEYIQFKALSRSWFENKPQQVKELLYSKLHELANSLSARCLFIKSQASKRLFAIEICQPEIDVGLEQVFRDITLELKQKSHCKRCCRVFSDRGCSVSLSARIFGIIFPILLVANCLLSIVGEIGLGKEIFGDREDLTAIGHFGEWPINAIEAAVSAYLLYRWYVSVDTDIEVIEEVYGEHLEVLDEGLQKRLVEVEKEEMQQIAGSSAHLQLITDRFEKMTLLEPEPL